MKKYFIFVFTILFFAGVFQSAYSNGKVNRAHKGLKVSGTRINCSYCHGTKAAPGPVQKKKQQMLKKQSAYSRIAGIRSCQGSSCHR